MANLRRRGRRWLASVAALVLVVVALISWETGAAEVEVEATTECYIGAFVIGAGGLVSVDGSEPAASALIAVACGTEVELRAIADPGYCVDRWQLQDPIAGCQASSTRVHAPVHSDSAYYPWVNFKFDPNPSPLRLTLSAAYDPCVVNTPTELSWAITGGRSPYSLTIDGETVDPKAESYSLDCGPPATDPQTGEPLPNQTRTFGATVTDARGVSASAETTVALGALPSAPTFRALLLFGAALELRWSAVTAAPPVSGYELRYQTKAWDESDWPETWTALTEPIAASETAYRHDGLDPDRHYRYQLRARNSGGAGDWSSTFPPLGAQPRPGAPTLTAQTAASGSVLLSWGAGPASTTRWEYRQQQEGGEWGAWTTIDGADATTVSHSVSGLTEDVRYHFQLRVANLNGAGLASETASAVAGLTPTVPSDRETLYYDVLDSAGEATESGAYAFLTNADDLTSGATTFAEASGAAALLLNVSGYVGRDHTDVLASVQVGDQITWFPYSGCWYHYRVTEILADPPTPARKLFRISLKTEDPCGFTAAQESDSSYFDDARDNVAAFGWNNPPSEPDIGADGIRILPEGYPVDGGHTYRLTEWSYPTSIVVDVPAGMRLMMSTGFSWGSHGGLLVTYRDQKSGSILWLDPQHGHDVGYYVPTPEGETEPPSDVVMRFESLIASIREQALP